MAALKFNLFKDYKSYKQIKPIVGSKGVTIIHFQIYLEFNHEEIARYCSDLVLF